MIGIHGRRPLVGEDVKSVASIGRLVSMSVAPSNLLKRIFSRGAFLDSSSLESPQPDIRACPGLSVASKYNFCIYWPASEVFEPTLSATTKCL